MSGVAWFAVRPQRVGQPAHRLVVPGVEQQGSQERSLPMTSGNLNVSFSHERCRAEATERRVVDNT